MAVAFSSLFLMKEKVNIYYKIVERRFSSSSKGTSDYSFKLRLIEYKPVIASIERYPLGGIGFGSTFSFYQPVVKHTVEVNYTHNGYLYLFYKVGIPLTIFFVVPLLYYLVKAGSLYWKSKDIYARYLALSCMGALITMILSNMLANIFNSRDGIIVIAYSIGLIEIINGWEKQKDNKSINT